MRLWLWAVAAATASVMLVGGITRLTHSGLSMVEWQPIIGVVPPLDDAQWAERFEQYRRFPEYQVRRDMSLGEFKRIFFWEYLHRLLARSIGLVFLVPFIAFWRAGYLPPPLARRTLFLFACGAAQGALGWWMVRSGLVDRPSVSHYRLAAHLALAVGIFGVCVWLALDLSTTRAPAAASLRARTLMTGGLALLGVLLASQIVWGAFVAGLKAGLLFNTFPLMGGGLVPEALLSLDPVMRNFVENPSTVQWTHRVLGTLLLCSTTVLFAVVRRSDADGASRNLNLTFAVLVAAQYLLGIATLIWRVPVGLAAAHQAMALAVLGVWVAWFHHVRTLRVS